MKNLVLREGKNFLAMQCEGYITIFLTGDCDEEHAAEFSHYLKSKIEYSNQHILINCESLTTLTVDWIKPLLFLQMQLSISQKKMRLVSMNDQALNYFTNLGATKAFCITDQEIAFLDFGIKCNQAS